MMELEEAAGRDSRVLDSPESRLRTAAMTVWDGRSKYAAASARPIPTFPCEPLSQYGTVSITRTQYSRGLNRRTIQAHEGL
jgi:hypothetical protein